MYARRTPQFALTPVLEAGRAAFVMFVETIEACQAAGRARAGDPSRIAVDAWSYVHGLVTLYLHGLLPRRVDHADLRRRAAQIVIFLAEGAGASTA
jgi:hypothetical protein